MKVAISLPDPLFEAAEELAARLGVTRSELFRKALERLLVEYDDAATTEALNRVHGDTTIPVHPSLVTMQTATLLRSGPEW